MGLSTCHIGTDVIGAKSRQRASTWPFGRLEFDSAYLRRAVVER